VKRKILSLCLVVVLALGMCPTTALAEVGSAGAGEGAASAASVEGTGAQAEGEGAADEGEGSAADDADASDGSAAAVATEGSEADGAATDGATDTASTTSADAASATSAATGTALVAEATTADGTTTKTLNGQAIVPFDQAAYDVDWYLDDPEETTFYIGNSAELRGLSRLVAGTAQDKSGSTIDAVSFEGVTIIQQTSINLYSYNSTDGYTIYEFLPIGSAEHPFKGSYTALSNTNISGLFISEGVQNVGLFGYIDSANSTIQGINLLSGPTVSDDFGTAGQVYVESATERIYNIGSLVGFTSGSVKNCISDMTVTLRSTGKELSTQDYQWVVERIGGMIGYMLGNLDGSGFSGLLDVKVDTNITPVGDQSEDWCVGRSFGGVCGRFGDPDNHGIITKCYNDGTVFTRTTGTAATDRFGVTSNANLFYVGGIVGYSNGSIYDSRNGSYNALKGEVTGIVSTSAQDIPTYTLGEQTGGQPQNNRGADQTGGIAGAVRSTSDIEDKYNDGDPDDKTYIERCYNKGQVTGLVATGGIVGETGVYCYVTACFNGDVNDTTQVAGKVISARWNKPVSGGIIGRTNGGDITYCANYAEVRNIQTGYYMAGIAGCLFESDDHPEKMCEMYSCMNTGGVYTVNTDKGTEYREAGICGQNEGYIHDCLSMNGCVPYHSDACIGASDWGLYSNLESWDKDRLQTGEAAAYLNANAAQEQDWTYYWFINGSGFPVLNIWADLQEDDYITLSTGEGGTIASVETTASAPYVGGEGGSIPTLKITLNDGTVLTQNTDFYVVPDENAVEMSEEAIYNASVVGLGRFKGTVTNCAKYAIGASTLKDANVVVGNMDYNGGNVVIPTSVSARINKSTIDPTEYEYVIYSAHVTSEMVDQGKSGCTVAFDSLGYISYKEDGSDKVLVSSVGIDAINAETRDYWLWDRNGELIADSNGYVYYTESSGGGVVGNPYSDSDEEGLVRFVNRTPAGFVVKITALSTSTVLEGSVLGNYVINTIDMFKECDFQYATVDGATWYWDNDQHEFYELDADGNRKSDMPSAVFTGETINPMPVIYSTLADGSKYQLVYGTDFRIVSGDPELTEDYVNRNVTSYSVSDRHRACATYRPIDTNHYGNYIVAYFAIAPAALEDCKISLNADEWAYTGSEIKPEVTVKLNGVTLIEDVDYTVSYSDNTEKGTASYTVTALENLSGGSTQSYSGTFSITDGYKLSDYTLDTVEDQQYNYGYDVHPNLVFRDSQGAQVTLTEGKDYTVSYSTKDVTRVDAGSNPDKKNTAWQSSSGKCVATITGIGMYAGTVSASFDIVPYDATKNATNQLRATIQEMELSAWKNESGSPYNVGLNNPIAKVEAYPIVDWAAYDAGDYENAYGEAILINGLSNKENGSLIGNRPARYYIYDETAEGGKGALVSYNGETISAEIAYEGVQLTTSVAPTNTPLTATVAFRVYYSPTQSIDASSKHNGATGILSLGTFTVTDTPIYTVSDSPYVDAYDLYMVTYTGEDPEDTYCVQVKVTGVASGEGSTSGSTEAAGGTATETRTINLIKNTDGKYCVLLTGEEVKSLNNDSFSIVDGTAETAPMLADVNGNGRINAVDSQVTYDLVAGLYPNFNTLAMRNWFAADANSNGFVDATDAYAILYQVVNKQN
jgi:hypothetical protein